MKLKKPSEPANEVLQTVLGAVQRFQLPWPRGLVLVAMEGKDDVAMKLMTPDECLGRFGDVLGEDLISTIRYQCKPNQRVALVRTIDGQGATMLCVHTNASGGKS